MFGKKNKDDCIRILTDTTKTAFVVHQEGKIVYSNKALSLITGYSNDELLQSISFWDIVHPEFSKLVKQRILAKQKGEHVPSPFEIRIQCKDGSDRWLALSAELIAWKGKPAVLLSAPDISQHKRDMKAIAFHHQLWKLAADISTEFINARHDNFDDKINDMLRKCGMFLDVDRCYLLQFSKEGQYMSNTHEWCAEDVIPAKNSMQHIPLGTFPSMSRLVAKREALFAEMSAHEPAPLAAELSKFNRQQPQSVMAIPLMIGNHLLGYFGIDAVNPIWKTDKKGTEALNILGSILAEALAKRRFEDDLHKARQQAELASQAKSRFLANMSHELRTPLNAVIGFTELLSKTPLSDMQQDYVENASHSARALTGVINDILDFSKIEAGKMDLHPIVTDIVSLSQQSLDMLRLEADKKQLTLRANIQPNIPRFALIDPLRLKQILLNLLSNAIKFTTHGEVELMLTFQSFEDTMGTFAFSIRDTGIGISEKEQQQLFSAFSQADNAASRKFGSTGLGLTISQMLAKKMGSYIKLESKPGKGTTFRFSIKTDFWYNTPAEIGAIETVQARESLNGIMPTILIAEDNSTNLLLTKTMLLSIWPEATVLEAGNGKEAVDITDQQQVDLILMDVQMPGMDGLQATRAIRQRETEEGNTGRLPIIALTAGVIKEEKDKCLKAGMNEFLAKPLNEQTLKEILSVFLKPNSNTNQAIMKKTDHEALQHFNMKELQERTELSREILLPMAEISMTTLYNYLQSLASAIQEGNGTEIKSLAHTIKGLALNMSFAHMTSLAKAMENQSSLNLQKVQEIYEEMKQEHEIVKELVKKA